MSYAEDTSRMLVGKTIAKAEITGFGVDLVFTDGTKLNYSASDGGYSSWNVSEACEAAANRKLNENSKSVQFEFCNAAAMREACTNIAEYAKAAKCHTTDAHILGYLDQIESWAKAALAKPPRNCDVGTAKEQRARFDKFCRSNSWDEIDGAHCMSSCPLYHGDCSRCEELEWAQMPCNESEATV